MCSPGQATHCNRRRWSSGLGDHVRGLQIGRDRPEGAASISCQSLETNRLVAESLAPHVLNLNPNPNLNLSMKIYFDHEKLLVYQEALRFVSWCEAVLERLPKTAAVHSQLDRART